MQAPLIYINTPCHRCVARTATLCASLADDDMPRLYALATELRFGTGDLLLRQELPADHVFSIRSGHATLFRLTPDGRRQILAFLFPGDFVGFTSEDRYHYGVSAIAPVEACRFERTALETLISEFPAMDRKLRFTLTRAMDASFELLFSLGRKDAVQKVASFLWYVGYRQRKLGQPDNPVHLAMRRADVADFTSLRDHACGHHPPASLPRTTRQLRLTTMSVRANSVLFKSLSYLGMVALIVVIGLPVFWLVTGAFKGNREILTATPQFLPKSFNFDNFARAWTGAKFSTYYVNSIATTLMGATAEIVMAVTTAYALVFVRFPFRNAVFILLLLALMVPEQVVIVPNFLSIARMGLLVTKGGALDIGDFVRGWMAIFLPGASIAFGTFLLRQYFRTIPMDLTDAAKVDGAGHFSTMINVIVPVATPAIATTGLLSFTAKWNEYLWPLIVTYSDQLRTLPIAISRLLDAEGNTEWGVVMAGAIFVVIPVIIVFLFAQRFVVEGLAAGAVKG